MLIAFFLLAECVLNNFQSFGKFNADRRASLFSAEAVCVFFKSSCHGVHVFGFKKDVVGGRCGCFIFFEGIINTIFTGITVKRANIFIGNLNIGQIFSLCF